MRCAPTACRTAGSDGADASSRRALALLTATSTPCRFPKRSLDLVVLPHTLELARDPHLTLREVERVLVPEGRVVICGFNPASLWGLRQRLGRAAPAARRRQARCSCPAGEFIGYWRLRDWLRLLSFEVEGGPLRLLPARRCAAEHWLERFAWMDRAGERWWPVFGAVYFLVAVKRVRGMRLVGPGAARSAQARTAAPRRGGQPPQRQQRTAGHEQRHEATSRDLHRRRLQGQPRPGRLGRLAAVRRHTRRSCSAASCGTTNNRMELTAVIEALAALKRACDVTLYIDSQYVRKGITEWIHGWKARGWRTADQASR